MNLKKIIALLLALTLVVGLAACGGGDKPAEDAAPAGEGESADTAEPAGELATAGNQPAAPDANGFNVAVNIASEPDTIDPALNSSVDGAIMTLHLFEGLMRWEDDGKGNAVLTEGQAESYEKGELAEDGSVTYTFNLRDDIYWSDGEPVVAGDFEYAIKRLVTPATAADYNYMADMILNANEIMAGDKEPDELGIKALDDKTLEIVLFYDCPYFLEVCAFPALLPVRQDVIEAYGDQWTFNVESYISNGALAMQEWIHNDSITMVPNEHYYNRDAVQLASLKFRLMDDFNSMLSGYRNGDLDFIENMPVDEIPTLLDSGELTILPYIGTYYVSFNNQQAPFDDARVREAFSLVIDRNYIVENITQTGETPADAYVPFGVNDAGGPGTDDFRTVGGAYYSVKEDDYQANCDRARELLAEAGYPDGEGFPIVDYLYNTNERHKVIGEALQDMWQKELGVTVTLDNQDWQVFLQTRKNHEYSIARNGWIADYNDPISFLDMWMTGGGNNDNAYSRAEYDEAIAVAKSTSDPAERMKAMHEAEDMFIGEDHAAAPIYFYANKYMMNDRVEGMYYTPLGYFMFMFVTEAA